MGTVSEDTLRAVEQRADTEFARRVLQSGFAFIPFALALAFTTEVAERVPLVFTVHVACPFFSYALRWYWVRQGWERYYAGRPLHWRYCLFRLHSHGHGGLVVLGCAGGPGVAFQSLDGLHADVLCRRICGRFHDLLIAPLSLFPPTVGGGGGFRSWPPSGIFWGPRAWMVNAALAVYFAFLVREASILARGYRDSLLNARRLEEQAAALEESRGGADLASELKSKFLVMMSHQIRTP